MQGQAAAGKAFTAAEKAEAGCRKQALDASPEAAEGQEARSLATGAEKQQQDLLLQAVEEPIIGFRKSRTQHVRSHEDAVVAASSVLPA